MSRNSTLAAAAWIVILLTAGWSPPASAQTLDQAVGELAEQIAAKLQERDKTKIAIVEFTDLSKRVTRLGRLLSEELTGQLLGQGGRQFQLVERIKVEEIFGEAGRAGQGQIEGGGASAVAALQGVDAILAGSAAELGSRIRINARLMSYPGGELITAASAYMSMDGIDPEILEPIGSAGSGGSGGGAASPQAKVDLKGVSYELLECREGARLIACDFVVTNNLADRDLEVGRYTRGESTTYMHDQRGYRFEATAVRIADVEGPRPEKRLIAELPMPMTVSFAGVPSAIDFIKVLHLWTSDGTMEFRDIPLAAK